MNAKSLFTALAFAAAAVSGAVQADEIDIGHSVMKFESTRTRAEVQAEAAQVPKTRSTEPAGTRIVPVQSKADRQAVIKEAVTAVRTSQFTDGEVTSH